MTIKDVIDGFREGEKENTERDAYANVLFQEAVRIGMELNNQYHTPEELQEIMGRLTGKRLMIPFVCFLRFIQILEKISQSGKMSLSIPGATFRIRAELKSGTAH